MEERSEMEKGDEIMLPGFRFHPTDEELVAFYLRRKIQQKPLSIELIRQLDIYKYDPWDLPNLATTGEKEWYFYCPRDRKYRNSARPNRVTGAGFWKATGTDRPIYSSEGTKCIGLKKSLVFYKGRAAKGMKTDWMMHEFRLPSLTDSSQLKKPLDKNIPPNDSWAICRIFKKSNSVAHRAMSHSWVSPAEPDIYFAMNQVVPPPLTCDTSFATAGATIQFSCNNNNDTNNIVTYPTLDSNTFKPINLIDSKLSGITHQMSATCNAAAAGGGFIFSPADVPVQHNLASMLNIDFGQQFTVDFPVEITGSFMNTLEEEDTPAASRKSGNVAGNNNQFGNITGRTMMNFPFSLPVNYDEEWKPSMQWDSSPAAAAAPVPACMTDMSAAFPASKCYT